MLHGITAIRYSIATVRQDSHQFHSWPLFKNPKDYEDFPREGRSLPQEEHCQLNRIPFDNTQHRTHISYIPNGHIFDLVTLTFDL